MITVFNDRIEILSRGSIPPKQTLEGFYAGESVPVNQKLSDMFLQLHISERTGRGVPKITGVYGQETYEFRENSIVVSIPFTRIRVEEMTYDSLKMTHDEGKMTYDKNKEEIERVLEFCTIPRTIFEIMELLGLKERKSARRHIKPLVEQGRLAMTLPDTPKSKYQQYIKIT